MKIYRVAVAGTGFIGVAHIDALRRLGNVDVVAICDNRNAQEQAAKLYIPHSFDDFRQMLDTIELDAVHICTPNHTHYEMALYALQKGLHVVCEKPFTATVEQAQKLMEEAERRGIRCAINYHNRFYPMPNHLRHSIQAGELGDVISVSGGYVQDWLLYPSDFNWRLLSTNAGQTRIVGDIGSHWMDLAQFVTGQKITAVMAEFSCVYPQRVLTHPDGTQESVQIDTEDIAVIMYRFANGAIGNAFVTAMTAGRKNQTVLSVAGTKAAAEWNSEDSNNLWIGHRDEPNQVLTKDPSLLGDQSRPYSSYPGGHVEGFPDAFKNHFAHFYSTLDDPSAPTEYATFADGLNGMLLCDAIYRSNQEKRWISL